MESDDETTLSEIMILPDGRIYVFGMSEKLLEVMQAFQADEPRIKGLLNRARARLKESPTLNQLPSTSSSEIQ